MVNETMTIHEALSELKIIGDRIETAINKNFVMANKVSNKKINGQPLEEIKKGMEANYQKVTDLIKRRNAIKKAVALSNAKTEVTIDGNKYTVAEAIELNRTGISYQESLMRTLARQLNLCELEVKRNNDLVADKAEKNAAEAVGKKESGNADEFERIRRNYIEDQSYVLVDPLGVVKKIEALEEEIATFKTKVDSALSISNATTVIEISY